jgi:hypothetical protein
MQGFWRDNEHLAIPDQADQAVSEDEEESKNGEAEEKKSEDSYRQNIRENPE